MRIRPFLAATAAALTLTGCAADSTTSTSATRARAPTGHAHHHRRASGHRRAVARHRPVAHRRTAARHRSAAGRRVAGVTSGQLTLITEPRDGVAPILAAIAGARDQIDMVMYEDADSQVDGALAAAEHRGVSVRVLLNRGYYGQRSSQNQAAYAYLKGHGVAVRWTPSYFALTHQKTLVVDGRAYILTFNLTPQYYASSRDFGVIDSNASDDAAIERTFDADWAGQRINAPTGDDLVWSPGSETAQVDLIDSASGWVDIYNEEMNSAAIQSALAAAARRGVNVRITMTADSEWDSAFRQLSAAGVHVRTYAPDASLYIHAKMILTPARVFLGSENFSETSMNENRELGLITSDAPVRASLAATFAGDYANATPYTSGGAASGGSSAHSGCSVTASYNSRYDDFDVDVTSSQDDVTATATTGSGQTGSYHTDSHGYVDIYLKAPESAAGQTVTVHVGTLTCSGTL